MLPGMNDALEALLSTLVSEVRATGAGSLSLDELAARLESARIDSSEIAWLIESLEAAGVEVESPPSEARANLRAVLPAARTLRDRLGRSPTAEELSAETSLPVDAVRGALFLGQVLGRG